MSPPVALRVVRLALAPRPKYVIPMKEMPKAAVPKTFSTRKVIPAPTTNPRPPLVLVRTRAKRRRGFLHRPRFHRRGENSRQDSQLSMLQPSHAAASAPWSSRERLERLWLRRRGLVYDDQIATTTTGTTTTGTTVVAATVAVATTTTTITTTITTTGGSTTGTTTGSTSSATTDHRGRRRGLDLGVGSSAPAAAAASGSQAVAAKSGDLGLDILDDEDWVPARREGLCELCIACACVATRWSFVFR